MRKGLQDLYPHTPARGGVRAASMPVVSIARRPAQRPGPSDYRTAACVNQSEKRTPSARECPGVARTRRRWDVAPENSAMSSPTGQATREGSGDAAAAGLEPDRVFYAGAVPMAPAPTGPTRPPLGGHGGCMTPTRDIGRRCPSERLRPRSKDDAAPEPRVPAEPHAANDRGRRDNDGRRDDDGRTGHHDHSCIGLAAAIGSAVESNAATAGGLGAERCQG